MDPFDAYVLAVWCALATTSLQVHNIQRATVYWNATQKSVTLKEGVIENGGHAYGYYNDSLSTSGWGVLEIRAGYGETQDSDEITFFMAGYLEGYLTAPQISSHYFNMYPHLIKDENLIDPLKDFMSQQDLWTREQSQKQKTDPLWQHVGMILAQIDGLHAGAAHWAKSNHRKILSMFAVQVLNGVGDLLDLVPTLQSRLTSTSNSFRKPAMGHCSALIKVLKGNENLFFAHSSWYTYAATMRIYKHWDFRLTNTFTATSKMSFSSYPGLISSLDDYYLLGSGLLMTQTTNSVFNSSLFSLVREQSLLAWQRVRLANALAHDGEQWAEIFKKYNSGTYNNQYMVVDLNKVFLGERIEDGALTVVEQIPGLVVYSDMSQKLRYSYWPSYNIPFHSDIYNLSGYEVMQLKYGENFSYDLCPRAKIFRRDQTKVIDMVSLKNIMRYNNYKKDPFSKRHPCKTICCRNDLRLKYPRPRGCYDSKVTDYQMARLLVAEAVNGPTTQGGLPPFSWTRFNQTAHQGLPQSYNFTFITMQPTLFMPEHSQHNTTVNT